MKRAAAAALALSVALSAAAPAALAKDYYIENGDITVTVTEEGDTYVRVGEAKDKDDIGEKDDTDVVIKGGENPGKQTENNSDGSADEAEGQKPVVDAEPGEPAEETGTELVVWPENVNSGEAQKKDGPEPADAEPKTPDTQKPVEEAAEDDDDIMTFENNTAGTVTRAVSEAAKHIITIINNYTKKDTTVTLEDVNIDVSDNYNAAMEVRGAGDTTLKLEGDNTLRGGHFCAGLEKDDEYSTGKLTITAEDTSASLKAYGGDNSAGIGGGSYDSTSKLEIANGKIYAESGFNMGAGIGGGFRGSGDVTILGGTVTAIPAEGSNSNVTGIGGGFGCDEKSTVRILGGVVDAVGNGCGSGIGGGKGDAQGAEVEIGGGAQVTAKGGLGDNEYNRGPGAAIGTNGDVGGKAGKELDVNVSGECTVTRIDSNLPADCAHKWTLVSSTPAPVGQLGEKVYECSSCGSTRTVYKFVLPEPAPVEEQNGRIVLTVIGAPYEMHQESTRYIVTADSDTATLFGCLGNLAELKAQGADTLVFRTKSRETALDIDTMLPLGTEDTLFTLTHSGSSATLTVGGADHSELIH
jgi:hypothetical protein